MKKETKNKIIIGLAGILTYFVITISYDFYFKDNPIIVLENIYKNKEGFSIMIALGLLTGYISYKITYKLLKKK